MHALGAILLVIAGAIWVIGGQIVVGRCHKRYGKELTYRQYKLPWSIFNSEEWKLTAILAIASLSLGGLGATFVQW